MTAPALQVMTGAAATPSMREAIVAPLVAFNDAAHGPSGHLPVAVLLRDAEGAITGGLWGECVFDWLKVSLLVVPDALRGQGLGRRLVGEAEAVARARGLAGLWLDTYGFQAREFYERLGFACFGTIEGHPRGSARHFMQKRL